MDESGPSADHSGAESTVEIDVVRGEERDRTATFGRTVAILAAIGLALSAVPPHPENPALMVGAIATIGVAGAALWALSRRPRRESSVARLPSAVIAFASLVLIHQVGVLTPIVAVVVFGLAFFANGSDTRMIFVFCIGFIVLYTLLALLVIAGVLPDGRAWTVSDPLTRAAMLVTIIAVMVAQFAVARMNRRALMDAITKMQEASRVARTREAQLDEERQERAAALRQADGQLSGKQLGEWSLGRIVGRGAMGEVYAAQSTIQSRSAAIKVLRTEGDPEYAIRFQREAEIARAMRGENLVEVLQTGNDSGGAVYIVMELLEGEDLAAIFRTQTSLPLSEVLALVEQAARGLSILHAAGIVHRDLKPQNLFRTYGTPPTWKILDYGVSKVIGAETVTAGAIVGTPGYMSPEQAEGRDVDVRSDVFALGAVAYRALTGRRPFSGRDTTEILRAVVECRPTRPREIVPSIPAAVEAVLAIALAKRPEDRFASAKAFAAAFRAAATEDDAPPADLKRRRAWSAEPGTLTLTPPPRL